MQKRAMLFTIISCLLWSVCLSQAADSVKNKKQKFCSVKLTKMNGTIANFILAGFTGDSMLGYSFYHNGDKALVIQNHLIVVKSADIRRLLIKVVKLALVTPTPATNDTVAINTLESKMATENVKTAATYATASAVAEKLLTRTIATPGLDAAFVAFDLLIPTTQKWYTINGDEIKFKKMAKELTPRK